MKKVLKILFVSTCLIWSISLSSNLLLSTNSEKAFFDYVVPFGPDDDDIKDVHN
ncbi:MAG: hypothetical protein ABS944_08250 [Solibacillus sp.]|jgi:hypothetical protein|uniref:hypothetical protein n=1 Tax=unclassified Solibacillus TaxID=2637870 RepID=UPI0030F6C18A